jgi:hypothetical protein
MHTAIALRRELSVRGQQIAVATGSAHELTPGEMPSVIFGHDEKRRRGDLRERDRTDGRSWSQPLREYAFSSGAGLWNVFAGAEASQNVQKSGRQRCQESSDISKTPLIEKRREELLALENDMVKSLPFRSPESMPLVRKAQEIFQIQMFLQEAKDSYNFLESRYQNTKTTALAVVAVIAYILDKLKVWETISVLFWHHGSLWPYLWILSIPYKKPPGKPRR